MSREEEEHRKALLRYYLSKGSASSREIDRMTDRVSKIIDELRAQDQAERLADLQSGVTQTIGK